LERKGLEEESLERERLKRKGLKRYILGFAKPKYLDFRVPPSYAFLI
jgi:hypothetical protein